MHQNKTGLFPKEKTRESCLYFKLPITDFIWVYTHFFHLRLGEDIFEIRIFAGKDFGGDKDEEVHLLAIFFLVTESCSETRDLVQQLEGSYPHFET